MTEQRSPTGADDGRDALQTSLFGNGCVTDHILPPHGKIPSLKSHMKSFQVTDIRGQEGLQAVQENWNEGTIIEGMDSFLFQVKEESPLSQ